MATVKKTGRPLVNANQPQQFVGGYVSQEQKRRLALAAELRGQSVNRLLGSMIDGLDVAMNLNRQSKVTE